MGSTPREYVVKFEGNAANVPKNTGYRVWAYDAMDAVVEASVLMTSQYPGHNHKVVEIGPPMETVLKTQAGNEADHAVSDLMHRITKS